MSVATRDTWRPVAIVFLVCLASLNAEVTVTRLLAYQFFYHFVFLALCLAHLGIAAAAAWVFITHRAGSAGLRHALLLGMAAAPLLFLGAYAYVAPRPLPGWTKLTAAPMAPYLGLLCLLLLGFYFCIGGVLAALMAQYRAFFNRLYAADLLGAALGCVAALALMAQLGPVRAFLASSLLALAAAALSLPRPGQAPVPPRTRHVPWAAGTTLLLAAVVGCLMVYPRTVEPRALTPATAFAWNHLARTDRVGPGQYVIDADASTEYACELWDSEIEYRLGSARPRVAIIGVGAGPQLRHALHFQPSSVVGVDINASIINWDTGLDRAYNGGVFLRPEVELVVDDARHALRCRSDQFDVIVMHAIDTFTASSSGAYSLTENYLYTVEAFEDYYARLAPGGVMAIRRWLFYPPRENLRLFTTVLEALARSGVAHPEEHVVVLAPTKDWKRTDLKTFGFLLFSKQPLSPAQLQTADEFVRASGWDYLYRPGQRTGSAFADYVAAPDRRAFFATYPYLVQPCYDANPYFFQFIRPQALLFPPAGIASTLIFSQSTNILFVTLGVLLALVYLLLGIPLRVNRRRANLAQPPPAMTAYFACLGIGFMAVELASIQCMTLFLGHPVYALGIILLGLLAFAGLGSALVRRLPAGRAAPVAGVIALLAGVAGLGLMWGVHRFIGQPFPVRVALTLAYLAVVGIPMGMPMALGVQRIGAGAAHEVAWAWACNGAATVLGTNVCMILLVYQGITSVFWVGAASYLAAQILLKRLTPAATPVPVRLTMAEAGAGTSTFQGQEAGITAPELPGA